MEYVFIIQERRAMDGMPIARFVTNSEELAHIVRSWLDHYEPTVLRYTVDCDIHVWDAQHD